MKKIPSLFKRNYDGDRLVRDEVVEGSEWVLNGEGVATVKMDGTSCRIHNGILWKRYDRKRNKKTGEFKPMPEGWEASEEKPNKHTGHWPGWLPVDESDPQDKWHVEGAQALMNEGGPLDKYNGDTCELLGPKIQGNPYGYDYHCLCKHGSELVVGLIGSSFDSIKLFLRENEIEGIVWHHADGRMVKIKRKDFGFDWPVRVKTK